MACREKNYILISILIKYLLLQKTMFKAPKRVRVLKGPKGNMILGITLLGKFKCQGMQ
jgi:hypothetical protein